METGNAGKMVMLKSRDGKEFTVTEAVAVQSSMFRNVIDEDWDEHFYTVHNVTAQTLAMLIEYCEQHVEAEGDESDETDIAPASSRMSEEELADWDKKFLDVDMGKLYDLMLAAHYLGTDGLLQLTISKVVDLVKGRTIEEIRKVFKIKNDFTAEEEEQIHRKFSWAFN